MHPYWIKISGHLGVGVTARSEADALHLFELAFGSAQKIVSIEIIKDMNDLDQNHVLPNLGSTNWLRRGIWFPRARSTSQTEAMRCLIKPRDKRPRFHYMSRMINLTATYWYFRSSLAAGGLRSI
ncbi:hypothetical protein FJ960_16385 [Mesorhizobium sp. B2-3-11]|uniref:hypothetical protein n=1 Tax=Mesorhizobium sp. B2-3-11 TaxID=2589953 RepID=UPI0011292822|nr:hypothetical protein [Mesorhizobium sp. B2-3-11]TPM02754.1 hypothetical protein FJ960_16385 [Mesorhizobium sp. B2-3-11]